MTRSFRKILVPYDFSTPARRALEVAADLAAERGGRLVVVNVVTPLYAADAGYLWFPERMFLEDTRRRLVETVSRVTRRRGVAAESLVVVGTPVERILNAARRVDLIVMSTMGRTGLSRIMLGSVAERVVRHAPVPVLTLRGHAGGMKRRGRRARSARPTRRRRAAR